MLTWVFDVSRGWAALIHDQWSEREKKIQYYYLNILYALADGDAWGSLQGWHVRNGSSEKQHCSQGAYEQYLTHACLIKVGGLELWRANLCLKFASSSWPWELLHWTECYLFGHLIHTQKWPLGAVFDKQTDWIACVSMCVVSLPRCPQGPSEMAPIDSRTWKIAHACPLTCPDYTSYYIDTQKCKQTYLIDQVQPRLVQYLLTHWDPFWSSDFSTF